MSNAKIKDRHRRDAEAALNEASSRYAVLGFISMRPIAQALADAEERGKKEAPSTYNTGREKMADILHRTANALHGGPMKDGWWSWHDLPELAEELYARVEEVERVMLEAEPNIAAQLGIRQRGEEE